MAEVLWLGFALGVGQALAVGPIFLAIVQQATAHGVGAASRVIVGATACNCLLLLPALLFAGAIGAVGGTAPWLGALGALCFVYLGQAAGRDARRLWRGGGPRNGRTVGPFWQGLVGSLANPLAWTLRLAVMVPALLHSQQVQGYAGLLLFVVAWCASLIGIELLVAVTSARAAKLLGARGLACISAAAALLFIGLAGQLVATSLSHFLAA
jgi:threonine/homoserine/homoserine lactone efflux protein